MAIKRYITANGQIIGEQTEGQSRLNYVMDPLGSVTAVTDVNSNVIYSGSYKPYGAVLASSGTAPSFTWNGSWGYNSVAGRSQCESYNRARFDSTSNGRWTSVDPIWPDQAAYGYVSARPLTLVDPAGLQADTWGGFCAQYLAKSSSKKTGNTPIYKDKSFQQSVNQCIKSLATEEGTTGCSPLGSEFDCLAGYCSGKYKVTFDITPSSPLTLQAKEANARNSGGLFNEIPNAFTVYYVPYIFPGGPCIMRPTSIYFNPSKFHLPPGWPILVSIPGGVDPRQVLLKYRKETESMVHEILHGCGLQHGTDTTTGKYAEGTRSCNSIAACCIVTQLNNWTSFGYPSRCIDEYRHWGRQS